MPLKKYFSSCLKFQNQQAITKLDFGNTVIGDNFPEVWQHERTLEELYLASTRLNSLPPQLFYCHSLRILAVNNNNLEEIPPAIAALRQLQRLDFSRNLLSTIPLNIKACKNLTHLDLSCNHLQRLPDAITCLISLQELLLNETSLEYLPANFGRLLNLRILELRLNNLINLPKSMSRLTNLQRLDIGGNDFSELPPVIGELKQLQELWIDFNQIRSDVWPNLSKLRELKHFEANNNQIETLLPEISNWKNIEVISICKCNLLVLPFGLGQLKSLVTLKCENNSLQELPDSIAHLEQLEELVISHNELTRLPSTIGMLRRLRFLFADNNCLTKLPDEICSCQQLSVLSLSRNMLSELPRNIGHLSQLKVLNIVHNRIITLPVSVLNLKSLTSLWISDNQSQPLVPLQYVDAHARNELTCFMLPQVPYQLPANANSNAAQATQQQYSINTTEHISSLTTQQSPNRRIYFAEEATILPNVNVSQAGMQIPYGVNSVGYSNNSDLSLMRSPTPYPKELRAMAKYVKNGQLAAEKAAANKEQFAASAEAKHLYFPIKTAERRVNYQQQPQIRIPTQQQQQQQQQPQQECEIVNANANIYEANRIDVINYNIYATEENVIPNIADNNSLIYVQEQMQPQQNMQNNNFIQEIVISQPQQQQPQQQQQQVPNGHTQFIGYQQQQPQQQKQQQQPPPYHLARAFSKKTAEDLSNYELIRQQQQQQQQQLQQIEQKNQLETEMNSSVKSDSEPQQQQQQMLNFTPWTQTTNSYVEAKTQQNFVSSAPAEEQQQNNVAKKSVDVLDAGSHNIGTKTMKKKTWLFGVHKNPTVKQITLKWEYHVGFDIKEIKNELNGHRNIVVSSILPNTTAASLLCLNDKLLEVDGVDLSTLSLQQTKELLNNAAPALNIMLSRV